LREHIPRRHGFRHLEKIGTHLEKIGTMPPITREKSGMTGGICCVA